MKIIKLFRDKKKKKNEKNSIVLLRTHFLKCVLLPVRLYIPPVTIINPASTRKRDRNSLMIIR